MTLEQRAETGLSDFQNLYDVFRRAMDSAEAVIFMRARKGILLVGIVPPAEQNRTNSPAKWKKPSSP